MAVWLQQNLELEARPAAARRVALALLGKGKWSELEPLLLPSVPAVDGVVRLGEQCSDRDLVAGRWPPELVAYDQILWLRPGEAMRLGNNGHFIRRAAQQSKTACLLPVHYPLPSGLTLLSLEPRWLTPQAWGPASPGMLALPLESSSEPPPAPPTLHEEEAWAVLHGALHALTVGSREDGFATLDRLFGYLKDRSRTMAGLVVRNGLAAALETGDGDRQERWNQRAGRYREYPEIRFLQALLPYFRADWEAAVHSLTGLLEQAAPAGPWVSGGGEQSYRALTFRGRAQAKMGALNPAVNDWARAVLAGPDYLPPLRELARVRVHSDVLDRLGLRRAWRGRSWEAAALVAQTYARSSSPEAAAEILQARPDLPFPKELRRMVTGAASRRRASGRQSSPGIRWEGAFFTDSSLARVNRELAVHLADWGWDLGAVPTEPQSYVPDAVGRFRRLAQSLWHDPANLAVTVRHRWPPSFAPVRSGRLVLLLPWEFGPVPRRWIEQLAGVDEVWVYSGWVRQCFIESGAAPERVHVVPCGFDPRTFCPDPAEEAAPEQAFQFLYVGGTIPRKGYDLALEAFLTEFGPDEPVQFTIKDFGANSFYRGSSGVSDVQAAVAMTAGARRQVRLLDSVLTDEALAGLYRSADLLVAPYRGEGFCLPALEAMACGTPALLPRFGPALDFARADTALLLEAEPLSLGKWVGGLELVSGGVVCQVPMEALRRSMRWAYDHREELQEMGRRAAADIHMRFTWEQAARIARDRLQFLVRGGSVPSS